MESPPQQVKVPCFFAPAKRGRWNEEGGKWNVARGNHAIIELVVHKKQKTEKYLVTLQRNFYEITFRVDRKGK